MRGGLRPVGSVRGLLLASAALIAATAEAAVFTVGGAVGSGQCTHATIQAAIDAAAASPGLDIIRLTRGEHPGQRLVVEDSGDLAIEGGFLACGTPVRVDQSTLDGSTANPRGPVIAHVGSGHLTLADLNIRGGDAAGAATPRGGGVSSTGWGHLTVYRTQFQGNRAQQGGGLYAGSFLRTAKNVQLIGARFAGNAATQSGGGLYVSSVDLMITGEEPSYFTGNHADGSDPSQGGGALFALDSSVWIDARQSPSVAFMDNNWSESTGGAIHFAVLYPGQRSLSIRSAYSPEPARLIYNTAARAGGAIHLRAGASGVATAAATLVDTIVSDNRAPRGSAFHLHASGSTHDNLAQLDLQAGRTPSGGPARVEENTQAVPLCAAAQRCNRVDRNVSTLGAAIELEKTGSRARASFTMQRGHLVDNVAGGGLVSGTGFVLVDNSVLAGNDAGQSPLIDNGGGNPTRVQNSTIAANTRITPALLRLSSTGDVLRLHNSIAFQPGVRLVSAPAGAATDLRNLLIDPTQPTGTDLVFNVQHGTDPMFVNAAQGDFRPRLGSPAVNRWSPGGGVDVPAIDLLGARRPAPPNGPTPYDFGAYEYGAVVDPIFTDTFERN